MVGSHFGVTDLTEQFIDLSVLWGKFETDEKGYRSFGGAGVSESITHVFTTRYTSVVTVTDQEWLLYDGVRYKVDRIENINEEKKFLRLYLIKQGSSELLANDG
jgi:hypothetical protein